MAVFDVSQSVIASAAGIVQGSTDISSSMIDTLEASLETMSLGALLGLWLQSFLIHVTMWALNIVIFVIVYGRMIEIYLLTSLAPLPVATLSNRELGSMGQNYLKSLFAVGFSGMLILVCVAIYAVLIQGLPRAATPSEPFGAVWGTRCCCVSACSKRGRLPGASLVLIKKGVLYAKKIRAGRNGPMEWKSPGGIFRGGCVPLHGGNGGGAAKAGAAGR